MNKEIRLRSGYDGIEIVKDSDGWYLCAGSYGYESFKEKPTKEEINTYAEELFEEWGV